MYYGLRRFLCLSAFSTMKGLSPVFLFTAFLATSSLRSRTGHSSSCVSLERNSASGSTEDRTLAAVGGRLEAPVAVRVVAEPGAAAALAALLARRYVPASGERVGVLVSGGNTTAVNSGSP